MSEVFLDEITKQLSSTSLENVENSGVSFEGRSLKLNTEDDGNYKLSIFHFFL